MDIGHPSNPGFTHIIILIVVVSVAINYQCFLPREEIERARKRDALVNLNFSLKIKCAETIVHIHNHIPRRCLSTTMSAQVNLNKFILGWNEFLSLTSLVRILFIGACQPSLKAISGSGGSLDALECLVGKLALKCQWHLCC